MVIILFSSLLVCIIAMFLYLHRSIAVLKKRSPVLTDKVNADINKVSYKVEELQEKATSTERFSGEVHKLTLENIEKITSINKVLEHDFTEWNNIYASFKLMVDDLNDKQSHYEALLDTMSLAEKHSITLHNEIKAFESIESDIINLKEKAEYSVQTLESKREEIEEAMQGVSSTIIKEIAIQKENGISQVQREIEAVKQIENNKIQNELTMLYNTYDKKTDDIAKHVKNEIQVSDETIRALFATVNDKYHTLLSQVKGDTGRVSQEAEASYIIYKNKMKDIVAASNNTIDETKLVYRNECENIMKKTANGIDEFEVRLREVKDSLGAYVESESDKMTVLGALSYSQLHENIEDRKEMVEKTMNDFIQKIDINIEELESGVVSKISELKTSEQEQYENFIHKTNELSIAVKRMEDTTIDKNRSLEIHIESVSTKLIDDYQSLEQGKEVLKSEIYEIKNEHESLEYKIRNQLTASYEEYTSDTQRYIEELRHNMQNESEVCVEDIRKRAQNSISDYQTYIEKVEIEYHTSLENKRDEFKDSFQDYQTELWNNIEKYKTHIDEILKDTHSSVETKFNDIQDEIGRANSVVAQQLEDTNGSVGTKVEEMHQVLEGFNNTIAQRLEDTNGSFDTKVDEIHKALEGFNNTIAQRLEDTNGSVDTKVEEMHQALEEFNNTIAQRLEDTGNTIEEAYVIRLTKRNEVFDEDIKTISTNIQRVDDEHKDFQKQLEEEYLSIRRDAEDKKAKYEQSLQIVEQKNKELSKDLEKTTERYVDFKKKYTEIESKTLQLQSEKETLFTSIVEIDNIKATLSSLGKEHKEIKKEFEGTSKTLSSEKNKLKNALSDYKHSLKMITQMDDKLKKTHRSMEVIEQQENNVESIKARLIEVQDSQHTISDFQKQLESWDKDNKVIDSSISNLLSRNASVEEKTTALEKKIDTWNNKMEHTQKSMQNLSDKYIKLDLVHTEIDDINNKMPEIMNNIEEFREMQESIVKQDTSMKLSLAEAESTIQTLGAISKHTSTLTKDNRVDPTTSNTKKLVRDLFKNKWEVESIAENLNLSIGEVELILQKNVI